MPTYKNQFGRPSFYDHDILDDSGKKVGTVRVKPSTIAWKPSNKQKFHSVALAEFEKWIQANGRLTSS